MRPALPSPTAPPANVAPARPLGRPEVQAGGRGTMSGDGAVLTGSPFLPKVSISETTASKKGRVLWLKEESTKHVYALVATGEGTQHAPFRVAAVGPARAREAPAPVAAESFSPVADGRTLWTAEAGGDVGRFWSVFYRLR